MRKIVSILLLCCFILPGTFAAQKLTLVVNSGKYNRSDCVVSADISSLSTGQGNPILLYEKGKKGNPVPCQILTDNGKTILYWILNGTTNAGTSRTFIVEKGKKHTSSSPAMNIEDTQKTLIVKKEGKNVLQYNYTFVAPPDGVDKSYGRSGFIHPAYSPEGNILTTIQPKDHYHHYGIWNPWTRVMYDNKMYDLWNIGDKQGTVRARKIEEKYSGNVFSGYKASLDHYIFTTSGEKIIMDELWNIKAWNVPGGYLWDFASTLHPTTPLPVILKEYRYAGFGYRANEEWTRENSEMFTSEGRTRQQIDGNTARWIYVTGKTATGRSGMLFLGHPDNYNSPEPLRIWDENANGGRGDVFINFAPTKNKDWELKPNQEYLLRYRVLSYEGEMTKERADQLWNDFAYPPTVEVR